MHQFSKTRLTLTLWYAGILLLILVAFSAALFFTYNNDITRIVLHQDFGNRVPKILSKGEVRLIVAQVRELRQTSLIDLLIIDIVTLIVGGGLSYFLAGKTLSPIQRNMASQKLFIADASHELRSPIATIQAATEVALRSHKKTKENYREVLQQVHEQSKRLGRLVEDLLSLSVLDAGVTRPLVRLDFSPLVKEAVHAMEPLFLKKDIHLSYDIAKEVTVIGDNDKLQQLIVILLDNARKYTPSHKSVRVVLRNTPSPQLVVADTGIGIDKQKQQAIFKRFYQAETSHSGEGAGLGLSIAESIMHLHKGSISVESTLGKGSSFICTFPRNKEER